MFKKLSRGLLDQEVMPAQEASSPAHHVSTVAPFLSYESIRNKSQLSPVENHTQEEPEVHIGENAKLEGSLSFDSLAKIEGHFTGELLSKGKIIVGPTAVVKADLFLEEAYVSGRVEGNITVTKRLVLEGNAKVIGDITAPSLSVAEGVSIQGQLHVAKTATPKEKEEELPINEEPSF